MRRSFRLFCAACLAAVFACLSVWSSKAQQLTNHPITVRFADGKVAYYESLDEALAAQQDDCVIYIPAGLYSVSGKEETKIKKRVTIYGAGCRAYGKDTEVTRISGSLYLIEGASSSMITGIFSHSNVHVRSNVKNVLIKNVDVNYIEFTNNTNTGCVVTSSVIRDYLHGSGAPIKVTNCLAGNIVSIKGGEISNCILKPSTTSSTNVSNYYYSYYRYPSPPSSSNSLLQNNIGLDTGKGRYISNCGERNNMVGQNPQIAYPEGGLAVLFVKYDSSAPFDLSKNDYHLKPGVAGSKAGTDGKDIGLYGGQGFDDAGRAPIPLIKIQEIAPQTDKDGKLKVKIKVIAD